MRHQPARRATDLIAARPRTERRPWHVRLGSALAWTVVLVLLGAYGATLAIPLWYQAKGERLLIVTSGSMAPKFQAGDAVVLHEVSDVSQLKEGQIITFWPAHGGPMVTHRVVGLRKLPVLEEDAATGRMVQSYDPDSGEAMERPYVQTKGDANDVPDADLTPVSRVRGIVLEVKPHWGTVLAWANSGTGRAALLGPPLAIVLTIETVSTIRRRRDPEAVHARKERKSVSDVLPA